MITNEATISTIFPLKVSLEKNLGLKKYNKFKTADIKITEPDTINMINEKSLSFILPLKTERISKNNEINRLRKIIEIKIVKK